MLFEDRGATLLDTIQRLPALTDFGITWQGSREELVDEDVSDTNGLPRCVELERLHSRSLTRLALTMVGDLGEGNNLRLLGLPELRSFQLSSTPEEPLDLRVTTKSFREAPQLQALRLYFCEGLRLQRGCLAALAGLTQLTLVGCGLRSVPAGVASLSATLRVLDLSRNDKLQIDDDAAATILGCGQLTIFAFYKPDLREWEDKLGNAWRRVKQHMESEGYTPAQLSVKSLTQLLHLTSAFRTQHGRELAVVLTEAKYMQLLVPEMAKGRRRLSLM